MRKSKNLLHSGLAKACLLLGEKKGFVLPGEKKATTW